MLSSFIIVFREILEAALVVGVLLAATKGVRSRGRWILGGILLGIFGACAVAASTEAISGAMEGVGQEVFNACVLLLAAALITWHIVWMKSHAPKLTREMKDLGAAVSEGRSEVWMLAVITSLAVLREGAEIVLFVYGLVASGQSSIDISAGGGLGLLAGLLAGGLIYLGLIRVPAKHVFSVTGWVLTFLAAGMASHAAGYLTAAGILPGFVDPVWNTSGILPEAGALGSVLHALAGYVERPSLLQVIVYLSTVGGIMLLQRLFGAPAPKVGKTAAVTVSVMLALLLAGTEPAHATKKVYTPYVELGELEVEYRGSVTFDDRAKKDDKQKHKLGIGYGVLERWFVEVYGAWANAPGTADDGVEYEATELENKFQLSEQGEYFVDLGFMVENEFAAESEDRDELKLILLLQKDWDRWTHRANPFAEYKYGGDGEEEWEAGLGWSTTYRACEAFEPGVEVHWAYENVEESLSFDEQSFQIGPVAYGKIGPMIKYDAGYLFGVSDDAPEGELKWIFEFEKHF